MHIKVLHVTKMRSDCEKSTNYYYEAGYLWSFNCEPVVFLFYHANLFANTERRACVFAHLYPMTIWEQLWFYDPQNTAHKFTGVECTKSSVNERPRDCKIYIFLIKKQIQIKRFFSEVVITIDYKGTNF